MPAEQGDTQGRDLDPGAATDKAEGGGLGFFLGDDVRIVWGFGEFGSTSRLSECGVHGSERRVICKGLKEG